MDGTPRYLSDDIWCHSVQGFIATCDTPPVGSGTGWGSLLVGGPGSADVNLEHLRVYNYAIPVDDIPAEALCTRYGDCQMLGVQKWRQMNPEMPYPVLPNYPFVPPSIAYVVGATHQPATLVYSTIDQDMAC